MSLFPSTLHTARQNQFRNSSPTIFITIISYYDISNHGLELYWCIAKYDKSNIMQLNTEKFPFASNFFIPLFQFNHGAQFQGLH